MRFEHVPFSEGEILDARPMGDGWATLRRDGAFDLEGLDGVRRVAFCGVAGAGTEVWTLEGEGLHHEPGFAPRRYHPGRKEFLSWSEDGAFTSRLVP